MITGASGFVGSALYAGFLACGNPVRRATRTIGHRASANRSNDLVEVGEINGAADWSAALTDVNCVIHCAARAHVMPDAAGDVLGAYRAVNVEGSRRLAEQAAAAKVRRLVYLSSIKVNGEQTALGAPFFFADAQAPQDAYGVSKWEAE